MYEGEEGEWWWYEEGRRAEEMELWLRGEEEEV